MDLADGLSEVDGHLAQCPVSSVQPAGSWSSGPVETQGDNGDQSLVLFYLKSQVAYPSSPSALLLEDCFPCGTWVLPRRAESGNGRGETQTWRLKANMWGESRARSFQNGVGITGVLAPDCDFNNLF